MPKPIDYTKAIELLDEGEDMEMRFLLSGEIKEIIEKSDKGEIALPDFLKEINIITAKGLYFLTSKN